LSTSSATNSSADRQRDLDATKITLSIALVTRSRPVSLERTLKSLRHQDTQPFEVIVSDDSDEHDREAVSTLARAYDCIYQRGPQRGLYANRNAAAKACRGTHFRTMDDDHEFPPDHIRRCLLAIERDREAIWIIGEIHASEMGRENGSPCCPGELHVRGFSKPPKNPQNCRAISCGATIYPRSVIDREILNAEYFRFGVVYLEYGCRLSRLGYRIRHLADTYVIHHSDLEDNSYRVDKTALAAQMFSMTCLALMYEPTLRNKLQLAAEFVRVGVTQPVRSAQAFLPALSAFRRHRELWRDRLLVRS
jgi:glycosyltransferase involved in cell wall biosynthesis